MDVILLIPLYIGLASLIVKEVFTIVKKVKTCKSQCCGNSVDIVKEVSNEEKDNDE